ncbi:dihydroorotase [Pseudobacteriovorax antillogorgiicola]|uniref:Dihydroorotase n=1 Tax=Pseudobacteriovorax antillogorgiicola TaxID=1513793 RepID=A0A1Y6CFY3_9BACT|nr:dihydroorotase [Pseudobacteriovorax antillogorgiicola]TCS48969.1 dihydroorotase [Pseudobacteriovorax antillogorgiicola]SMF53571.1 dihydroorotase [Pseudobacteriovorax antillogorgiicola]
MTKITIKRPDDWHLHLRDGDMLGETVPATARCFKRAIVMPNLVPPVTTGALAMEYRSRITEAIPPGQSFEPLMTIFLTNETTPQTIAEAKALGVTAAKLYPAGATTNSDAAVSQLDYLQGVFEALAENKMPLLVHGEVTDHHIDIFDREKVFIESKLVPIVDRNPDLKVVLEHITTKEAAEFVLAASDRVAATITPQHLLLNRNDLLVGGVRPHNFCLPVLKRNTHQEALRKAVASKTHKIFLGTDSAPHEKSKKENACGCAGCYSAWSGIELYAQIFEDLGILDHLEAFASINGPKFYDLPINSDTITLEKSAWQIPKEIILPNGRPIVPFFAGETVAWRLVDGSK